MSVNAAPELAEVLLGWRRFVAAPSSCARPVPVLVGGFRLDLTSFSGEVLGVIEASDVKVNSGGGEWLALLVEFVDDELEVLLNMTRRARSENRSADGRR